MHIDEDKKFDRRNIKRNIKDGITTQNDYEIYLSKLPDASGKLFNPEGSLTGLEDLASRTGDETQIRKKGLKKKTKGK